MTTELLSMCGVDLQKNFHSELSLEEFTSKRAAEASEMLSLSVLDHFRCPKDFLDFGLSSTQDYMLFHILNQCSIDLRKNQVEMIMGKNGLASFLVHPEYVREHESKSVYLDLLGYLRDLRSRTNVWAALPHEVDIWWRARSSMIVEPDGSTWRVVGEGSERAVLAYAKTVNGKLVYELPDRAATLQIVDRDLMRG